MRAAAPAMLSRILALLQQLQNDPKLADKLLDRTFQEQHGIKFDVKKFQELWKAGYDIWRLKALDLGVSGPQYRVLYAYDTKASCFYVLAVVERSFNYDPNHEITCRVRRTYEELGLQIHRL